VAGVGELVERGYYNRDRWDVALDSGVLIRLFHEIDSRRWFVEGSYD